jgi:FkbM family methyltransferase
VFQFRDENGAAAPYFCIEFAGALSRSEEMPGPGVLLNNRRVRILRDTLRERDMGGSWREWVYNTFGPTAPMIARRLLRSVETSGDFYELTFHHLPGVLYISKGMNLSEILQVVAEQGDVRNWHYYTVPETDLSPEDVVFDCGCAEGIFPFLNREKAKKFVCFEPLPSMVEGLRKTFTGDPRVEIVPMALGAEPATAYLDGSGINARITSTPTDQPVRITTIDRQVEESGNVMSYLKADVEGYEMELLRGATETIRRHRPKVAITVYHRLSHAREIGDFLRALVPDYQIRIKGKAGSPGHAVMLHAR